MEGRGVAPGVSLFIVPASFEVRQKAENLGYMEIFEAAGAMVLKSGCGACINAGFGILGKEETGVYATNRNFKGRSKMQLQRIIWLPRVVAISPVEGKISDRLTEL